MTQAHTTRRPDPWTGLLLLAAAGLLAGGVALPIMVVETLWLFEERVSLLDVAGRLASEGEWVLAAVVGSFSILFPALKIVLAARLWLGAPARAERRLHRLDALGRWSMLDVLILALVVFSLKAGSAADATSQPGLYLFLGAVLASMGAVWRLRRRHGQSGPAAV